MFVFIDIYTHSLLFVSVVFYSCPSTQDKKQTSKRYQLCYWALLFIIFHLLWYRVIVGNGSSPFRKLSAIYFKCDYYGSIHLFGSYTYYLLFVFSMLEYIYSTISHKQDSRVAICPTGCEHWVAERFEGQAYCWEQYWLYVVLLPVLKWLSWFSTSPSVS